MIFALSLNAISSDRAEAAISCTPTVVGFNYVYQTSTLGPLAVGWNWGGFGPPGGWVSPDGNPHRTWSCGADLVSLGPPQTNIKVLVQYIDNSFAEETVVIDCSRQFWESRPITAFTGGGPIYVGWPRLIQWCFQYGFVYSWCEAGF